MIIVTGGLGFIGSNLVHALNAQGRSDIILADDFTDGTKFANVADAHIEDYLDKGELLASLDNGLKLNGKVEAIIHQGACSSTTEWNGKLVMENNFSYSKALLHSAEHHDMTCPIIGAKVLMSVSATSDTPGCVASTSCKGGSWRDKLTRKFPDLPAFTSGRAVFFCFARTSPGAQTP